MASGKRDYQEVSNFFSDNLELLDLFLVATGINKSLSTGATSEHEIIDTAAGNIFYSIVHIFISTDSETVCSIHLEDSAGTIQQQFWFKQNMFVPVLHNRVAGSGSGLRNWKLVVTNKDAATKIFDYAIFIARFVQ